MDYCGKPSGSLAGLQKQERDWQSFSEQKKQKASSKPVSAKKPKSAKPKSAAKKDAGKKSVKAKKDASIQKTKAHSDTAYGLAKKVFSARKLDCAYLKSLSHFPNLFMNALMDFDGWFT